LTLQDASPCVVRICIRNQVFGYENVRSQEGVRRRYKTVAVVFLESDVWQD
jgi:hypothetical protein